MIEPQHFDVVILDLNMPILDGYEACKQILQIYKEFNDKQIRLIGKQRECLDNEQNSSEGHSQHSSMLSLSDMLLINKAKNMKLQLQDFNYDYVERRPIMIASSAFISDKIQENCISIGFDYITDIPFQQEFVTKIFQEIDAKNYICSL